MCPLTGVLAPRRARPWQGASLLPAHSLLPRRLPPPPPALRDPHGRPWQVWRLHLAQRYLAPRAPPSWRDREPAAPPIPLTPRTAPQRHPQGEGSGVQTKVLHLVLCVPVNLGRPVLTRA